MALAFVYSRWFATSTIIGATTPEPLKETTTPHAVALTEEAVAATDANPCTDPESPGKIYDELCSEITWLCGRWLTYRELFC